MMSKSRKQVQSVSPFRPDFLDYIDEEIRDLVSVVIDNGHLLIYSCEGHKLGKPRYLSFSFVSTIDRDDFIKGLQNDSSLRHYSIECLDTFSEEIIDGNLITHGTIENEVKGCNYIFNRKEQSYCFVRLTIGYALADELFTGEESYFENMKWTILKFRAIILNFFIRKFETKNFERYFLRQGRKETI